VASRRNRHDLSVSLFPFLSVLACVIGTLTLLIAALAFTQIASEASPARDPDQPEPQLAALIGQDMIEQFARKLEELSASLSQAASLDVRRDTLEAQLLERGLPKDLTVEELDAKIAMLVTLEEAREQIAQSEQEVALLHATLKDDHDRLERSRTLPDDAPIALMPRGDGSSLAPYFVECRADGVRIRRKNRSWSEELHLRDLVERGRFRVFLEKVRSVRGASAIFLMRPDAVKTCREAEEMANQVYARHGKLPIPGDGPIDLRLVEVGEQDAGDAAGEDIAQ
jgi:hypothetical protein